MYTKELSWVKWETAVFPSVPPRTLAAHYRDGPTHNLAFSHTTMCAAYN